MSLAAAIASGVRMGRLAVAELKYQRATTRLLLRDKAGPDAELDAYYALINLHTGSNLSADSILKATVRTAKDRYASLGFDLNSPEFAAAVDATIRGFQS